VRLKFNGSALLYIIITIQTLRTEDGHGAAGVQYIVRSLSIDLEVDAFRNPPAHAYPNPMLSGDLHAVDRSGGWVGWE
jgi:hypothetical protein